MATILRMPEVSANATHATLVKWNKQEGDFVATGECLADIETEKAIIELNAEADGILGKILVKNGEEVAVGAPIAVLFAAGETHTDTERILTETGTVADAVQSSDLGLHETTAAAISQPQSSPVASASAFGSTAPAPPPAMTLQAAGEPVAVRQPGRILSSPVGRLLAQRHGIDLATVRGSGPNGRVIKHDVQQLIDAPTHSTAATSPRIGHAQSESTAGDSTVAVSAWIDIPHTNMRRTIARRLMESKTTVPHFYLSIDCRMDRLLALRAEINAAQDQKISITIFVLRATALALRDVPGVNVAWSNDALRQYQCVDIAIAVSTDSGLITPIIRNAANKSLATISSEVSVLAARARVNQLHPHEFQGGGFTVSNLGMFGVDEFAAIINPPQAGILAVGAIRAQPVVEDGQIKIGHLMRSTLSVDHRAVDGALAAIWLAAFRRLIESPLTLLI